MNGINAHSQNTGLSQPGSYESDLKVEQLDRDGEVLKGYVLRGAFPTELSPIDVSYGSSDEIERFTVSFAYQYHDAVNANTTT